MALNERSRRNLVGVHPDLVKVVELAAEREPFIVTEGLRTLARQKQLKAAGKSWTLNSRHLNGHAVDVVDPDGKYDIPDMDHIAKVMKVAAKELGVAIEWGGDWKSRDTPHFQLDWKSYPETGLGFVSRMKEKAVDAAISKPAVVTTGVSIGVGVAQNADKIPTPPIPDVTTLDGMKTATEHLGIVDAFTNAIVGFGGLFLKYPWLITALAGVVVVRVYGLGPLRNLVASVLGKRKDQTT
jgi:peptidoglycan L-alanyl-D-glutamate endopeptidase CwlK